MLNKKGSTEPKAKTGAAITRVTKNISHDRMSVRAKFPNKTDLRFSISRYGERLSSNALLEKESLRKIMAFCDWQKGETNQQRVDRIAAFMRGSDSIPALVVAIANKEVV